MKHVGLGISYSRLLADLAYNISKAASEVVVGSLLGGTDLNYVTHKVCVRRSSSDGQRQQDFSEKAALMRRKEMAYGWD